MAGLLDRSRTVAPPGFNRWLVPPAALCIHLCIGMAYGFSVFWLPLTHGVGIDHSVVPPPEATLAARLVSTEWDWDKPLLGWLYTLFFVFLGSSAWARAGRRSCRSAAGAGGSCFRRWPSTLTSSGSSGWGPG